MISMTEKGVLCGSFSVLDLMAESNLTVGSRKLYKTEIKIDEDI